MMRTLMFVFVCVVSVHAIDTLTPIAVNPRTVMSKTFILGTRNDLGMMARADQDGFLFVSQNS